ncbi:hypothetical protein [Emticicia sp. SJ17W-69]|uniref:hypothetical protein n=1 Tax=Emticicia sp. SJ17W-69 TaxID=3421657 RepID=UPI003EBF2694
MKTSKIYQLNHAHFEHKLWRNELESIAQESNFFLKILDEYKILTLNNSHQSLIVAEFVNQFHHYQRLINRLIQELSAIERELAQGVLNDKLFDSELKKDHQYLNEEMIYFESDYRATKVKFREFIASQEEVPILN